MKLLRVGEKNKEIPAILDEENKIIGIKFTLFFSNNSFKELHDI